MWMRRRDEADGIDGAARAAAVTGRDSGKKKTTRRREVENRIVGG